MANETEIANISHQTDVLSDATSAALVQKVVALPLIHMEDIAEGVSNVKLFQKDGSLSADEDAESTAYSFGAGSEFTMTEVSSTATRFNVASKLTLEALKFTQLTIGKIAQEQSKAIKRDLEGEVLALTSGFSNQVTSTAGMTVADILDGIYTVRSSTAGVSELPYVGWLDYKAINELIKFIMSSGASCYSQESQTSLLRGVSSSNGWRGNLPGVALYELSGLPTDSGDDVGLIYDPNLAFGAQIADSIGISIKQPEAASPWFEAYSWTFFDVVEWNDAAGCGMKSDS